MHRSMKTTWTSLIALPLMLGLVLLADIPRASAKSVVEDEVLLVSCGHFPGRAKRRFRMDQHGDPDLRIEISNAPAGSYSVTIGNADGGVIQVNAFGQGEIEYDTSPGPGERLLNFPLDINTEIDLFLNATTLAFSFTNDTECVNTPDFGSTTTTVTVTTNTTTTDVSNSSTTTSATDSSTTTSDPDSSTTSTTLIPTCQAVENVSTLRNCSGGRRIIGKRRVRVHTDCERDLRIKLYRVQPGNYDVFITDVDGTPLRGTITAARSRGRRGEGEIEFDDTPAVNELPLTFDPFGGIYLMRSGQVVLAYPTCP